MNAYTWLFVHYLLDDLLCRPKLRVIFFIISGSFFLWGMLPFRYPLYLINKVHNCLLSLFLSFQEHGSQIVFDMNREATGDNAEIIKGKRRSIKLRYLEDYVAK